MSRLLICLIFLLLLASCMDNGRAGRSKIQNYASIDRSGEGYCQEYAKISTTTCELECAEDYHVGTPDEISLEIEKFIQELDDDVDESAARADLNNVVKYAKGICIKTPASRPSDEVFVDPKFCACQKGKPFVVNDCEAFCTSYTEEEPKLFVTTTVGPKISSDTELVTTKGWCNNDLTESVANHAPSCILQLFDGINTIPVEMDFTGDFSFTADLSKISKNKTYVATIYEVESGAKSKPFQLHAVDIISSDDDNSPLKIMPISQYTCIYTYYDSTVESALATDFYSGNMSRIYLYYPSNKLPEVSAGTLTNLFCHDIIKYGRKDSILYPRLELIPNSFALWDKSDIRFYDADNNTKIDINEQIQNRLINEYGIASSINIFNPITYATSIIQENGNSSDSTVNTKTILQGFYMQPWIDRNTKLGYCPKQEHYHGDAPVFRILKEIIGIDTEALYFGKSAPSSAIIDQEEVYIQGSIIMIRESVLKKIWFYYENGQPLQPNEVIAGQKEILFYYPPAPNYESPYVKKSYQKLFKLYHPQEAAQEESEDQSLVPPPPRTDILPPNKMFGCVPSLGDAPYIQSK